MAYTSSLAGEIAKKILDGSTNEEIAQAAIELGQMDASELPSSTPTSTAKSTGTEKTTGSSKKSGSGAAPKASAPVTSDVAQIYEVLAPMAGGYLNAQAEQIGQAQRSMGPLAARTMGTTTSGLGNYTYNRLMRPQVATMRDELLVQGYANQLNRLLSDALNKAKKNYSKGSGSSKKSGGTGTNKETTTEESNAISGYTHVGEMDSETGLWKDPVSGGKSGEVLSPSDPIAGLFGWLGEQVGAGTEVGGGSKQIIDILKEKGKK